MELGKSFPYPETLEDIAEALDVAINELFEFEHLGAGSVNVGAVEKLLEGVSEEKLRLIYKVIKAMVH